MDKVVSASILPSLYYWDLYSTEEATTLVEDLKVKAETLGINLEVFLCTVTPTKCTINAVFVNPEDATTFRDAYF